MPEGDFSVKIERRKPTGTRRGLYKLLKRGFDTETEARAYIEFNGNKSRTYAVFEKTWRNLPTQIGGQKAKF